MSDVFYIIGTGPSVNKITDEEWQFIEDKNTMGLGFAALHHKKYKYYLAYEGFIHSKDILDTLIKDGFLDTTLILARRRVDTIKYAAQNKFNIIRITARCAYFLPSRRPWYEGEPNPPHPFRVCRAKSFREPIFRFRGSLTAGINVALILGADEIRLVGVDLLSMKDSWEDHKWCRDEEDRIMVQKRVDKKNEDMEYRKHTEVSDSETLHTTARPYKKDGRVLVGIQDNIKWMDKELKEEGHKGIFICSKDSLLYKEDKLEYKGIMDD